MFGNLSSFHSLPPDLVGYLKSTSPIPQLGKKQCREDFPPAFTERGRKSFLVLSNQLGPVLIGLFDIVFLVHVERF